MIHRSGIGTERALNTVNLQLVSFGLAILLGVVAFGLMKYTADEYDKWYEQHGVVVNPQRLPVGALSVVLIGLSVAAFTVSVMAG
jgi:hypothetical protein